MNTTRWHPRDSIAALTLFTLTAAFVLWQSAHVASLMDISYILNIATSIAHGNHPYRDFPFPFPPLTFLTQAVLIKLFGPHYAIVIAYAAITSGIATIITWRILIHTLRTHRLIATILAAPLAVLGTSCIFPHPFYDADATLIVLLCILLLQHFDAPQITPTRALLTGALCVIPVFIKQNVGLFFLAAVTVTLITLALKHRTPRYIQALTGIIFATLAALARIHFASGLHNYFYWTIQYATTRRLPNSATIASIYAVAYEQWTLPALLAATIILYRTRNRIARIIGIALATAPFLYTVLYLFLESDPETRAEPLLALWPPLLILALCCAVINLRQRLTLYTAIPFILLATINGAFLSQQLWGSTYAIWPLLVILIAQILVTAAPTLREASLPITAIASLALIISGASYALGHSRLIYIHLDGPVTHSHTPATRTLSTSGTNLADFDELIAFTNTHIPKEDALIVLPGEDPFFYATARRPQFPIVLFERTTNPYEPAELVALLQQHNVRWIIAKRHLQLTEETQLGREEFFALIAHTFTPYATLANYTIYRRN